MKITISYIAGEEKEAALIQRFAERLLDDVEVLTSKDMEGMCCDCLHEREPFCGDYSENMTCPDRKEDGSCWTSPTEQRTVERKMNMVAKIIDPKTGAAVRLAEGAEELAECLLKIQESGEEPLVLQIGDGDKQLHVIPC